jgi:purine nucleoside phosphorylase
VDPVFTDRITNASDSVQFLGSVNHVKQVVVAMHARVEHVIVLLGGGWLREEYRVVRMVSLNSFIMYV